MRRSRANSVVRAPPFRSHQLHSDSEGEQRQIDSDRLQYISFLEGQVHRVDAACERVTAVERAMSDMQRAHAQALQKANSNSSSVTKSCELQLSQLAERVTQMESASRQAMERVEQRLQQMERVYAGFAAPPEQEHTPTSSFQQLPQTPQQPQQPPHPPPSHSHSFTHSPGAPSPTMQPSYSSAFAHHSSSSFGQPPPLPLPSASALQLPAFLTSFISNAVAAAARDSESLLRKQLEPLVKATGDTLATKHSKALTSLQVQSSQQADALTAQVSLLSQQFDEALGEAEQRNQKHLGGVEERWLGTLEQLIRKNEGECKALEEQVRGCDERIRGLQEEVTQVRRDASHHAELVTKEHDALRTELATVNSLASRALQCAESQSASLEHGMASFNDEIGDMLQTLDARARHAEELVGRLSLDTLSRQEHFHAKVERFVTERVESVGADAREALDDARTLREQVEQETRAAERKMKIMAQAIRDNVESGSAANSNRDADTNRGKHALTLCRFALAVVCSSLPLSSPPLSIPTYAPLSTPTQMSSLAQRVDERLESLRTQLDERDETLLERCMRAVDRSVGSAVEQSERKQRQWLERAIAPLEEGLRALQRWSGSRGTASALAALEAVTGSAVMPASAPAPSTANSNPTSPRVSRKSSSPTRWQCSHSPPRAISSPDVSSADSSPRSRRASSRDAPLRPFAFTTRARADGSRSSSRRGGHRNADGVPDSFDLLAANAQDESDARPPSARPSSSTQLRSTSTARSPYPILSLRVQQPRSSLSRSPSASTYSPATRGNGALLAPRLALSASPPASVTPPATVPHVSSPLRVSSLSSESRSHTTPTSRDPTRVRHPLMIQRGLHAD